LDRLGAITDDDNLLFDVAFLKARNINASSSGLSSTSSNFPGEVPCMRALHAGPGFHIF
jgi:hypothetical protein